MATLSNPRGLFVGLFLVLLVALVGAAGLIWRQTADTPEARFVTPVDAIGARPRLEIDLTATHGRLASLRIDMQQAGERYTLLERDLADTLAAERRLRVDLDLAAAGLQEGEAVLLVHVADDFWRPRGPGEEPILRTPVQVDLTPPRVDVRAATRYPEAGGAGVALVHAEGAAQVRIEVGEEHFRAHAHGGQTESNYVALFALEIDHDPDVVPQAVAVDGAGNETRRPLPVVLRASGIPTGSVELDADWLRTKLPELLPGRSTLAPDEIADAFLEVSVDQRAQAAARREELARQSGGEPLWEGVFLQMPNASALSSFGVRRTYHFQGQALDEKVHQGYDLASVRNAPIPAAASGIVVHAGPLTLYGNTVIVDHGLGLLTLYGHCSSVEVVVGDRVERGQALGHTGATGLAVGDHLHFEVVVGGTPVNPLQWWDRGWIRDHIEQPLRDAGAPLF